MLIILLDQPQETLDKFLNSLTPPIMAQKEDMQGDLLKMLTEIYNKLGIVEGKLDGIQREINEIKESNTRRDTLLTDIEKKMAVQNRETQELINKVDRIEIMKR